MNDVAGFKSVAPYLKDPLVLIGFFLLLAFSFSRYIIKQRIIPPLPKTLGYKILRLILLYGFIIGLLLTLLGFAIRHQELTNQQRAVEKIESMLRGVLDRAPQLSDEKRREIIQQVVEAYRSGVLSEEQVEKKIEEINVSLTQYDGGRLTPDVLPNASNLTNKGGSNASGHPLTTQVEEKKISPEGGQSIGGTGINPYGLSPNSGLYIPPTIKADSANNAPLSSPPIITSTPSPEKSQKVSVYGCLAGGSRNFDVTGQKIYPTTGSTDLNEIISEEMMSLTQSSHMRISVYFLQDGPESAFFTPTKFPALMLADHLDPNTNMNGSVFINTDFLVSQIRITNNRRISFACIIGHQFAHAMQYRNDFPYASKWRELHADFMAGWYASQSNELGGPDVARGLLLHFYDQDDYDFFDSRHGNPQERAQAFYQGYSLGISGTTAVTAAYDLGLQYVRTR